MNTIFKYIGIIHSPFEKAEDMPIQSKASNRPGKIVLFDEYLDGLEGLSAFSHIILLYHFHKIKGFNLKVKPFLNKNEKGIFATRAPVRPNPIGLSIVKINEIRNKEIIVESIDVLDGTPLLDIKPYIPKFDIFNDSNNGWLNKDLEINNVKSDSRFLEL